MAKKWWEKGVRFQCQGSGKCCMFRNSYGYVYLTKGDRRRFAKFFGISTLKFTKNYCDQEDGKFFLREETQSSNCRFLEGTRCSVYEARPTQCRTWPFWPENMNQKAWNKEITQFCPGAGKGRLWSRQEIEQLLKLQKSAEEC